LAVRRDGIETGSRLKTTIAFAALWLTAVVTPGPAATADFFQSLPAKSAVLWVGAHSDDESLVAGALLAELASRGFRVHMVAITHGSSNAEPGGEYDERGARARRRWFHQVCSIYAAHGCLTLDFPQPAHRVAPGQRFRESAREVLAVWRGKRLIEKLRELLAAYEPACVITLDPDHGMYGHPEHQAAALAVLEANSRMRVYAAENMFQSATPGNTDPGPIAWRLPGNARCGDVSCWDVRSSALKVYKDMFADGHPPTIQVPPEEQASFLRRLN
jgi:LmbE family N-acetylglucosaminyl deacetylase